MKIEFEKTNVVQCIFSLRQTNNADLGAPYDEYDRRVHTASLKRYMYCVPEYLQGQLKVGDYVVVHCTTGFQICEIVEINVQRSEWANPAKLAPVVCKVDLHAYSDYVEHSKQVESLRSLIKSKKKQLEAEMSYDYFAERSPEFKQLLDQFRELGGQF